MPIIDLQRRMTEVGRIRMGHTVGGTSTKRGRPAKLEHWRLTSRDRSRLEGAATLYGGTVQEWADRPGEWELYTNVAELPILLLPGQTLSQWWETWSGGGCTRRCDGERETITETPCVCDTEGKKERSCKPTSRLSVMLPDVPGLGVWRLESHGYYAAVELAGTSDLLERATVRGQMLPARLRIDQRRKIEGGKTTRYAVPVIDIDVTTTEALRGITAAAAVPMLDPVPGFVPLELLTGGVTADEAFQAIEGEQKPAARRGGRQTAPMGPPPTVDPIATFGDTPPLPTTEDTPAASPEPEEITTTPVPTADSPDTPTCSI